MSGERCTCQYGNGATGSTPYWYVSVKTCPLHHALYDPLQAPEWAATHCGEGGREVWADRQRILLERS